MYLQGRALVMLISVGSALSAVLPARATESLYVTGPLSAPGGLRLRRTAIPTRAIMYSGYFGAPRGYNYNPPFHARNYEPQGAMTAFAAGNSVSTRSYYGNEYQPTNVQPNCGTCLPNGQDIVQGQPDDIDVTPPSVDVVTQPELPVTILSDPVVPEVPADVPEENPESLPFSPSEVPFSPAIPQVPEVQDTPDAPEEDDISKHSQNGNGPANGNGNKHSNGNGNGHANGNGGTKSAKTPKAPPKKPDDEDEYDEDDEQVFLPGKGRGPGKHYNSYFPIYFGLPGYGSRGQGEGGPLNPGVATAIANSYSNGRGAVATSHATAYGGPNFGNGSKKGAAIAQRLERAPPNKVKRVPFPAGPPLPLP
ncbi:hypothetical protein PR048_011123 [Dryococelus australis]|uniref:Uncharacterized protein n=1 Tax=Dryococelus australis TaxID=614101 RepID=A0ABQ9HKR8_9NEOP|nr:hypothetical protein PR048_011123 [Dryococelus australis]